MTVLAPLAPLNPTGDLERNFLDLFGKLRARFPFFKKESDIGQIVEKITIIVDGKEETFEVVNGKFKTAGLFLYFAEKLGKDRFVLQSTQRNELRNFMTDDICKDAVDNPDTKHLTVRSILNAQNVEIIVHRRAAAGPNPIRALSRIERSSDGRSKEKSPSSRKGIFHKRLHYRKLRV